MLIDGVERLGVAKAILDRQLGWIAAAEGKAGFVVAIDTAMIAGLAAAYGNAEAVQWFGATMTVVSTLLGTLSIFCAAVVVRSRIKGPAHSLVFFKPIATMSADQYCSALKAATVEQLLDDLSRQIHRNAQIAAIKHDWSRRSILAAMMAGIAWIAAISILVGLGNGTA